MAIKRGGQHEGGFRREKKDCIYPLELLYVPRMYIKPLIQ